MIGKKLLQDLKLVPLNHIRMQEVGSASFQAVTSMPVHVQPVGSPAPVPCNIVIHGFKMLHRRTNHFITGGGTDTVHLAPALNVDGVTYTVDAHNCGDLGDTSRWYGVNFGFQNVPIVPTSKITFTFSILNAGGSNKPGDIQTALNKINDKLLSLGEKNIVSGDFWTTVIGIGEIGGAELLKELESLIFADCDGPVAADRYDLTGSNVLGEGGWSSMRIYPGVDSPHGCGANSKYAVSVYAQRQDVLATVNDTLKPGQALAVGAKIYSEDHDFRLDMQPDGHLVVWSTRIPSFPMWSAQTNGKPATQCVMQTDGNLVIENGSAVNFSTNTQGHPGAYAIMQNDGNFVVYDGGNSLWSSKTEIFL